MIKHTVIPQDDYKRIRRGIDQELQELKPYPPYWPYYSFWFRGGIIPDRYNRDYWVDRLTLEDYDAEQN